MESKMIKVGLVGNPNVGKSTVFNALTGMKQHTGNWPGKTVESAIGEFECDNVGVRMYDLPGTYSLISHSREEEVTRDFIYKEYYSGIVVVCDAVCLERNLNLVLQVLDVTNNVLVCVNLIDEAKKKGIEIDFNKLSKILNVPVIPVCARKKEGLDTLAKQIISFCNTKNIRVERNIKDKKTIEYIKKSEEIAKEVVIFRKNDYDKRDRKIDKVLTNKLTGIPIMLALLGIIFWITIVGANYPSQVLYNFFEWFGIKLYEIFDIFKIPDFITGVLLRRWLQSANVGSFCYASTNGDIFPFIYIA